MNSQRIEVIEEFEVMHSSHPLEDVEDTIPITAAMEYEMEQAINVGGEANSQQKEEENQGLSPTCTQNSSSFSGQEWHSDADSNSEKLFSSGGGAAKNDRGRAGKNRAANKKIPSYCTAYTVKYITTNPHDPLGQTREYQPPIKKRNIPIANSIINQCKKARNYAFQQVDDLMDKAAKLELQIAQLTDNYDDEMRDRDNRIVSKNDEITQLNYQITRYNQDMGNLKNTVAEKDAVIGNLSAEKCRMRMELEDRSSQIDLLKKILNDLESKFKEKEKELSNLVQEYESIRNQLSSKQIDLTDAIAQRDRLHSEKASLETRMQELNQIYNLLQKDHEALQHHSDNLSRAKDELILSNKQEITALQIIIKRSQLEIDEKAKMIEHLNKKVHGLEWEKNQLDKKVQVLRGQLTIEKMQRKTSEKENIRLRKSFNTFTIENDSMICKALELMQGFRDHHSRDVLNDIIRPDTLKDIDIDGGSDSGNESQKTENLLEEYYQEHDYEEDENESVSTMGT